LHLKFFPEKKRNEWFTLGVDDIIKFKEYCRELENTANILKDNPFAKKILK
jgi:hypothetical protein